MKKQKTESKKSKKYGKILLAGLLVASVAGCTTTAKPEIPIIDFYANPVDEGGFCLDSKGAEAIAVYIAELEAM